MPYAHSDKTQLTAEDVRARLKLEGGKQFVMHTEFAPAGDQPTAIKELAGGVLDGDLTPFLSAALSHALGDSETEDA